MKKSPSLIGPVSAALAFLGTFCFFQFAYPYHLVRREQLTLFVFDRDYIAGTYRGTGWLARFCSDFLEQFFHLPVAGPLIVALLLTAVGFVVFRICRHFLGRWPSLAIAALVFAWSFLRETGNLYLTRYTLVTLGYLSLVWLALQCRKAWMKPVAAVLLIAAGSWFLGSPYHKHYGKAWGRPLVEYDKVIGLDAEIARENWDKVVRMSKDDLHMVEASYCYNLAHAMKGDLGSSFLNYSQKNHLALLFPVDTEKSIFTNTLAGEAWFHLGDMTVAEQSAITSLQASPKHTGARFLVRLARVNLVIGEDAAATKYLNLLSKTLFYGKWARSMMPGHQDEAARAALAEARSKLHRADFVHHFNQPREVLQELLEVNPANRLARDYLLSYDLLRYDLEEFMEDYLPDMVPARLYQEAVLIWLSQHEIVNPEQMSRYGVDQSVVDRMSRFGRNPSAFKNTYWYYYWQALNAYNGQ